MSVTDADGTRREIDRSDELIAAFRASGFDALIAIGGDGSMQIAWDLACKGLPVVCVPKTIDNDVECTQQTFGFDTAVSTATEAIDKLHSTAESHQRVMVVELMGRNAGWIALHSGISGTAARHPDSRDPLRHRARCATRSRRVMPRGSTSASWWWRRARGRWAARCPCSSDVAPARSTGSAASAAGSRR